MTKFDLLHLVKTKEDWSAEIDRQVKKGHGQGQGTQGARPPKEILAQKRREEAQITVTVAAPKQPKPAGGVEGHRVQPSTPSPQSKPTPAPEPEAALRVNLDAPYDTALKFLGRRFSRGSCPTLGFWQGVFVKWTGTHWADMKTDALKSEVYDFLSKVNGGKFDPKSKHVNELIEAIKARVIIGDETELGTWLDENSAPPWGDSLIICCKNGVVRLSDGKRFEHDPRLFVVNAIETEYRPDAEAPRWMQFLEELWADDEAAPEKLQQFFGLALTDVTRFQKGFILVGPARSGKGTIGRMLRNLLGAKNCCGPTLTQMSKDFGLESFIGKKVAVIPDARPDPRANLNAATERMLSVIGEDPQDINCKNRPYWNGILRTRIMICSNELPQFKDNTGTIVTRFIILQLHRSFLGEEDLELEGKLKLELPGILNWAIAGWQGLAAQGKFSDETDDGLAEEMANMASPIKAFVAEHCELGDKLSITIDKLYTEFKTHCANNGVAWAERLTKSQFSSRLQSAFPRRIKVERPRINNPGRPRLFFGLRLRPLRPLLGN